MRLLDAVHMFGKQAKTLSTRQVEMALRAASNHRHPARGRTIILLWIKAGFRAEKIAGLTWPMVLDAQGRLARQLERMTSRQKKRQRPHDLVAP
jgi:hypothetical protein